MPDMCNTTSQHPVVVRKCIRAVARPRGGGLGAGLNPLLSSGASHEICAEPMIKYWGTPFRNVVPANTLVLAAHLVTFLESQ